MQSKNILRKELRSKRRSLDKHYIAKSNIEINKNVISLLQDKHGYIGFYKSIGNEVSLDDSINYALLNNIRCAAPAMNINNTMYFKRIYDNENFIKNDFGFSEPMNDEIIDSSELSIIFIPCIGVDMSGNRLGHGFGHFDTFLNKVNIDNCILVGVIYDFQLVDNIPKEHHDIPMHYIVTETEVTKVD